MHDHHHNDMMTNPSLNLLTFLIRLLRTLYRYHQSHQAVVPAAVPVIVIAGLVAVPTTVPVTSGVIETTIEVQSVPVITGIRGAGPVVVVVVTEAPVGVTKIITHMYVLPNSVCYIPCPYPSFRPQMSSMYNFMNSDMSMMIPRKGFLVFNKY